MAYQNAFIQSGWDLLTSTYRYDFPFFSLLKGAQEVRLRKRLIAECGGELQEFCIEDIENFEGVLSEETFFTSSERQTIVNYYLMSLRAMGGDAWGDKIKFSHGQAISEFVFSYHVRNYAKLVLGSCLIDGDFGREYHLP